MLFLFAAFADAAVDPIDFPVAPAYAVPKVRKGEGPIPILLTCALLILSRLQYPHCCLCFQRQIYQACGKTLRSQAKKDTQDA